MFVQYDEKVAERVRKMVENKEKKHDNSELNAKKKEYLQTYQRHVRRVNRIEAELTEVRAMKGVRGMNTDGMPRGSNQSDLSGYAAELDELERQLIHERYRRVAAYKEITEQINKLESENERDVLFYRYIKGLAWWEISEKMEYSERHIRRLHGSALIHFETPQSCPRMSGEKGVL